ASRSWCTEGGASNAGSLVDVVPHHDAQGRFAVGQRPRGDAVVRDVDVERLGKDAVLVRANVHVYRRIVAAQTIAAHVDAKRAPADAHPVVGTVDDRVDQPQIARAPAQRGSFVARRDCRTGDPQMRGVEREPEAGVSPGDRAPAYPRTDLL